MLITILLLLYTYYSAHNAVFLSIAARQFGPLLLRRKDIDIDKDGSMIIMEPSREELMEDIRKKTTFLKHFLIKEYDM